MITISLCMIVKNEEDVLARCLDSVQGIVDEIIIVDTGSTDTTKQIAARYTNHVYDFVWIDDFAAARNFSFSKATKEYIFWLDADDVFLEPDRKAFEELKRTLDPSTDLVMMKYHVGFDAQGNPNFTYHRERLLRRAYGYRWVGAIHEVIVPTGNIVYSEVAVTHRKLHPSDPDRNLRIFEKMIARGEALDPRQQFYYGRELYYHGRYQEAAFCLNAFLDEGKGWVENNISACLDLANCYDGMDQPELALRALSRSFCYDSPRAEICCAIGAHFLARRQYEPAVFWYQMAAAMKPDPNSGGFTSPDCYNFIPYLQLCVCYDRMGDHKTAEKYHRKARRLKPGDPSVRYNDRYFKSLHKQRNGPAVN